MTPNEMTPSQEELNTTEPIKEEIKKEENASEAQEQQHAVDATTDSEAPKSAEKTYVVPGTKEDIIRRMSELSHAEEIADKEEIELLKKRYYRLRYEEVAAQREAFINAGGNEEEFEPKADADEERFKAELKLIKEKRAQEHERQEKIKQDNLKKKLEILEKIKTLSSSLEDTGKNYDAFRKLQAEWKEANPVPAENATELWKNYEYCVENFYDMLKLNNEFREYDFKKNLEIKTRLCETAEKLNEEADVISAFQQLQALHQEFKETGPVAKELREEIWARFKAASTAVNKRHQQYFEELKQKEEENLAHKTALCEKIEAVDLTAIKTATAWEAQTQQIIEMQKEWRTIGFAPQKMNVKIFERFRGACDRFFTEKAAFFKRLKEEQAQNLAKKTELCEKAEALKDSTDWKATADKLMQIQKEWKTIGAVPKKHSESLWQRFIGACDYFFEQKGKNTASQRGEEKENLQKKEQVIEKLKALLESDEEENKQDAVRELMREWNEIGFVPFKEKDKIYKAYHETVDQLFKALNMSAARRRLDNFKNNLKNDAKEGGQGLSRERERLVRAYENKRSEIKTYENNLGFLTCSSKKGSNLLNEMNKKMEKLKDELNLIGEKIAAIDKEMSAQAE